MGPTRKSDQSVDNWQVLPLPDLQPGQKALRRGRVSARHHIYLVTTATDQRRPIFHDFDVSCAAARCFENRCFLGDANMLAWVLMPDHVHWLLQLGEQDGLVKVVSRLKSASGRQVNRVRNKQGKLWQEGFHDHALRSDEDIRVVARYMVGNPIRAGLAERINDYPFWDAVWV